MYRRENAAKDTRNVQNAPDRSVLFGYALSPATKGDSMSGAGIQALGRGEKEEERRKRRERNGKKETNYEEGEMEEGEVETKTEDCEE